MNTTVRVARRRHGHRVALVGWVVSVILWPGLATAADAAGCGDELDIDRFQHVRQVTLDVFNRVPTEAEASALIESTGLSAEAIESMLDSDEFSTFIDRYHQDLLWTASDPIELVSVGLALLLPASVYTLEGSPDRLFLIYAGLYERGGIVPCADKPAEFDDNGEVILEDWPDGTRRDGWVMVEPYWAPGTQVKVCALEAREHLETPSGERCDEIGGMATGRCGCGPQLRYCGSIESVTTIEQSLREQVLRMFRAPIREGGNYFDALTAAAEELNGPLLHYYNYLVKMTLDPIVQIPPVAVENLPKDVPFHDQTWESYQRTPEHSGVLTSLGFLIRFQTGRARAARFYSAMLCDPFVAPEGTNLPSPSDECSNEPNLRKRCGCNSCHAELEPAAAHWARFANNGTMYLHPFSFPLQRPDCATCKSGLFCDPLCDLFYLTEAAHADETPYLGTLRNLVFADEYEVQLAAVGPRGLVEDSLQSGLLQKCVVRRLYSRLHGRELTADEQTTTLSTLTERFEASGYDFRALMLEMLTSDSYRRMLR